MATDGRELIAPRRRRVPAPSTVAELAGAARELAGAELEPIVFVHRAAHERWDLPAFNSGELFDFFAGARRIGHGSFVVDGAQRVYITVVTWVGDFAGTNDVDELLASVEAFRRAVGRHYLFSAASTAHHLIRRMAVPPPEPLLVEPDWGRAAYTVPAFAWSRPLTAAERARPWVQAFDRGASFLAAWRGVNLSDGDWQEREPTVIGPGSESSLPTGYWLVSEAARTAVAAAAAGRGLPDPLARWDVADGPLWVTTPLLHLAVDLAGGVDVERAWVSGGRGRFLDDPAARLVAARDELAGGDGAGRLALDVVKECYSAGTGWLEYGTPEGHALHRPHWYRTITDRHVANTYRSLAKAEPRPWAWSGIDCALFALDGPDAAPAGLRLGTTPGLWKPKGHPLAMAEALAALDEGDVAAVLHRIEG